jgi:hypothetical protein
MLPAAPGLPADRAFRTAPALRTWLFRARRLRTPLPHPAALEPGAVPDLRAAPDRGVVPDLRAPPRSGAVPDLPAAPDRGAVPGHHAARRMCAVLGLPAVLGLRVVLGLPAVLGQRAVLGRPAVPELSGDPGRHAFLWFRMVPALGTARDHRLPAVPGLPALLGLQGAPRAGAAQGVPEARQHAIRDLRTVPRLPGGQVLRAAHRRRVLHAVLGLPWPRGFRIPGDHPEHRLSRGSLESKDPGSAYREPTTPVSSCRRQSPRRAMPGEGCDACPGPRSPGLAAGDRSRPRGLESSGHSAAGTGAPARNRRQAPRRSARRGAGRRLPGPG